MEADRRHHDETYRGHKLSVDAEREGTRWTWRYLVDGKHDGHGASHAKLADAEAAMRRAIQAARARADDLRVAPTRDKPLLPARERYGAY
jgi:hypothetical protein